MQNLVGRVVPNAPRRLEDKPPYQRVSGFCNYLNYLARLIRRRIGAECQTPRASLGGKSAAGIPPDLCKCGGSAPPFPTGGFIPAFARCCLPVLRSAQREGGWMHRRQSSRLHKSHIHPLLRIHYTKSPSSSIAAHRGISPAKFPILGKNVIMPRKAYRTERMKSMIR